MFAVRYHSPDAIVTLTSSNLKPEARSAIAESAIVGSNAWRSTFVKPACRDTSGIPRGQRLVPVLLVLTSTTATTGRRGSGRKGRTISNCPLPKLVQSQKTPRSQLREHRTVVVRQVCVAPRAAASRLAARGGRSPRDEPLVLASSPSEQKLEAVGPGGPR